MRELYHCCRFCHYFDNGRCCKSNDILKKQSLSEELMYAIDDGGLAEGLREILSDKLYDNKEIEVDEIIGQIEVAIKNLITDEDDDGIEIKEPSEFYCKYYE